MAMSQSAGFCGSRARRYFWNPAGFIFIVMRVGWAGEPRPGFASGEPGEQLVADRAAPAGEGVEADRGRVAGRGPAGVLAGGDVAAGDGADRLACGSRAGLIKLRRQEANEFAGPGEPGQQRRPERGRGAGASGDLGGGHGRVLRVGCDEEVAGAPGGIGGHVGDDPPGGASGIGRGDILELPGRPGAVGADAAAGAAAAVASQAVALEPGDLLAGRLVERGPADGQDVGAAGGEVDVGQAVGDLVVGAVVAAGDAGGDPGVGQGLERVVDLVDGVLGPDVGPLGQPVADRGDRGVRRVGQDGVDVGDPAGLGEGAEEDHDRRLGAGPGDDLDVEHHLAGRVGVAGLVGGERPDLADQDAGLFGGEPDEAEEGLKVLGDVLAAELQDRDRLARAVSGGEVIRLGQLLRREPGPRGCRRQRGRDDLAMPPSVLDHRSGVEPEDSGDDPIQLLGDVERPDPPSIKLLVVPDLGELDPEGRLHRRDRAGQLNRMRGLVLRLHGQPQGRQDPGNGVEVGRVGAVVGDEPGPADRPGRVGLGQFGLAPDLLNAITSLVK